MTTIEFEHIILKIRPQMVRVALDFFHNEEDAEDAVQNVLFKMWKRDWKPDDDVTALAIRATKNECVSMARKQRLRLHLSIEDEARSLTSANEADQDILTNERRQSIEKAINNLSRSEQRIIRLTQDKGLNAEEIAIVTGIKLPSVRSMLSMARKKLIEHLSV
ncbi:MAG: sigma-70 family RNA polymerase sigma factor [Prevotella sp.]|nr:sigma-70 family RNA polymerase sigma factor [Candidatus Prevotella equi]